MTDNALSLIADKLRTLFPKGCSRVMLINPPVIPEDEFDRDVARQRRYPVFPPYGLGIINRELKKHGYVSRLVDLNYAIFANNSEYDTWRYCLCEQVREIKPDLCVITCMYSMTHPSLKAVSSYIKELDGSIPIITGGVHPTAAPEVVLKDCPDIDFVMLVDGESSLVTVLELVNGISSEGSLRQLGTLIDKEYTVIDNRKVETDIDDPPDFDELPIGDYHQLGRIGAYHNILPEHVKASTIISNRGCRGNCVFCSVNAFFGGSGVRMRAVSAVVDEMQRLKEYYGITHFMWLDDDLLFNESRAIRLFREISDRRLDITWDASNGVVASSITPALAESASDSGCIGMTVGIESGNTDILRAIRKPSGIHHFRQAAEVLRSFPEIFTKGFLMLGFLGETVAQIQDTVNLARELSLDWYPIQILTPFPATGVRKQLEEDGLIGPDDINARFFLGSTGGQRRREADEKKSAKVFCDPFNGDMDRVPTPEELKDLWFVMDYRVNYEKILSEERSEKLALLRKMLSDICERVPENPLATMYLGIVDLKLGNKEAALKAKEQARRFLDSSDFWCKRFEALGLHSLL